MFITAAGHGDSLVFGLHPRHPLHVFASRSLGVMSKYLRQKGQQASTRLPTTISLLITFKFGRLQKHTHDFPLRCKTVIIASIICTSANIICTSETFAAQMLHEILRMNFEDCHAEHNRASGPTVSCDVIPD